jgi:hypothetical protein
MIIFLAKNRQTYISFLALGTVWTLQSSQPGLSLYDSLPIAIGTAYYVTSLGVNILVTILITIRLVLHRQSIVMDALPPEHAVHGLSVATIVIESAALYSAVGLCFLVSYAINNPLNQIFMALASSCQVCNLPYSSFTTKLIMIIANCCVSYHPAASPRTRLGFICTSKDPNDRASALNCIVQHS